MCYTTKIFRLCFRSFECTSKQHIRMCFLLNSYAKAHRFVTDSSCSYDKSRRIVRKFLRIDDVPFASFISLYTVVYPFIFGGVKTRSDVTEYRRDSRSHRLFLTER